MIRALALVLVLPGVALAEAPRLPFDVGGAFALTDQHGDERTQADPDGRAQLLFFGYANCQQICSAALPLMADIADELAASGLEITPVMITVDPNRDTVAEIGPPLASLHPDFVGLTGTHVQLQVAYDAFSVEIRHIFDDPEYGPIYAHGSFIYLLDGKGAVLALLPPILPAERAAAIARTHLAPAG